MEFLDFAKSVLKVAAIYFLAKGIVFAGRGKWSLNGKKFDDNSGDCTKSGCRYLRNKRCEAFDWIL